MVQVLPGVAMLPPVRVMLVVFAAAVTVPPQVLLTPGVEATCSPFVSVSLNAMPFSAPVLAAGLVMVNVNVVVPFSVTLATPNALLIVGGATTLIDAVLLVVPVPPSVEVTAPAVLFLVPAEVPVTLTEKTQEPPGFIAPLERLTTLLPEVAVMVPAPQLPLRALGVATTNPAGIVSVKLSPFRA